MVLNKAGRNWVPHAQGKIGALLWVLCSWTWCGEDYKIKAVGNWLDFHSLLPTMGSVERSNVRIKGRSRLDLHLSYIYIMRMEHCWNIQHLEEVSMTTRGIIPLEGTWRCFNCKQRQEHKILEEHSSNVDEDDDLARLAVVRRASRWLALLMRTRNVSDSSLQYNQGEKNLMQRLSGSVDQGFNMQTYLTRATRSSLCTHLPDRRGKENSRIMKIIQASWAGGNERMDQSKEGEGMIKNRDWNRINVSQ